MEKWSLIDDAPSFAALNMAVDEYLLREAQEGGQQPVLRIYSFDPPAVTIGFHQDPLPILDLQALARDGIQIVRRVTGGRALLHDGELTYSIVARTDHPSFRDSLQKTFLDISGAVVEALRALGVSAAISGGRRRHAGDGADTMPPEPGPSVRDGLDTPCLVSTSRHEVTAGGRKIVGSAQRRSSSAFLQHGSILLRPASEKIADYLLGDFGDLSSKITSIEAETGRRCDRETVRAALVESFGRAFGARFMPRTLGLEESNKILEEAVLKQDEFSGGGMTG